VRRRRGRPCSTQTIPAVASSTAKPHGLPGVVADRYGDTIVLQLTSAGAERWRDAIVAALGTLPGVACIFERSDADVRVLEGLPPRTGVLHGELPAEVLFDEGGIRYRADVVAGQKTGFYLDQRDNRATIRALAAGCEMLNVFCYTGGFTLSALAGGARRVVSIDSSADALVLGRENLAHNPDLPADRATWVEADAFAELRKLRDRAAAFDLIVLDPPKFAPTAAHAERAARAYKDVNLLALKLLRQGGLLATFFVLRRNRRRPLPQDRRGRCSGRPRGRGRNRPNGGRGRPSCLPLLPRRRLPQRSVD
jgi:23S rRNA (cytosine1962-C5)-methyltransferase